jgi:hypothetical protein
MLRSFLLLARFIGAPLEAIADDPEPGFTWLPGGARVIPRTSSASRDTPVLEYAYGPRAQGSLGGEFGFLEQRWPLAALRLGMYGMITLENDQEKIVFPREYWRGHAGVSLAVASEALGRQWFGPGAVMEFAIVIGHERPPHRQAELARYLRVRALRPDEFPDPRHGVEATNGEVGEMRTRLRRSCSSAAPIATPRASIRAALRCRGYSRCCRCSASTTADQSPKIVTARALTGIACSASSAAHTARLFDAPRKGLFVRAF